MLFHDHATGLTGVYGLKAKTAEATNARLQEYLADTAQLGVVTCLLSDGGTELQGEFSELCRERRIEHRTSVAYYHNGNARAERMWETLLKNTCTMLQHSHLPDVHWYRALQHAAYVYNRTPRRMPVYTDGQSKTEKTTPYYQNHKVIPNLSMLKVWGCLAFADKEEKLNQDRGKLDDRAMARYHVGICRHSRGWDVYIPSITSGYITSRHTRFDEQRYYGKGALDPAARGSYSHPSEYLNPQTQGAQENHGDGRDEAPTEADLEVPTDHPDPRDCEGTVEPLHAADGQPQCRLPGCLRPLNHEIFNFF